MTVLRSTQQSVLVLAQYDPEMQVTQCTTDVAYRQAGTLRSTRAMVQVLYSEDANKLAENTLVLTDEATYQLILGRSASNDLSLDQDAVCWLNTRVGSGLVFSSEATVESILVRSVTSTLSFTQSASWTKAPVGIAENTLVLTQEVRTTLPTQEAENTLSLTQSANPHSWHVESLLELTSEATAYIGGEEKSVLSELTLTQVAAPTLVVSTTGTSALALLSEATVATVISSVTTVSDTLTLSQVAVATLQENYIIIQAPWPAVADSIVLPNPLLDDKEHSVSSQAVKRAMDGTTYTYVKKSPNRMLSYTFDLSREKGLELQSFLDTYNGELFKLQNWKGEIWSVNLMTNPLNYTQNVRGPNVGVNLQFEGTKISG